MVRGLRSTARHISTVAVGWSVVVACLAWSVATAASGSDRKAAADLSWGASTLEGRRVVGLAAGNELTLDPDRTADVVLAVTNDGRANAQVFEVRLTGRVLGMTFFDYGTQTDAEVQPGASLERSVEIELDDLSNRGVGLVPTSLRLMDEDGKVLLDKSFPVAIRGSLLSSYGIFGLAIAGSTLVLLLSLLFTIWRGLLPENRWRRALHFLPVGTGLGLTLTFTLSALRLLPPSGTSWATFMLVLSAGAFALGYFLPLPYVEEEAAAEPAERTSG